MTVDALIVSVEINLECALFWSRRVLRFVVTVCYYLFRWIGANKTASLNKNSMVSVCSRYRSFTTFIVFFSFHTFRTARLLKWKWIMYKVINIYFVYFISAYFRRCVFAR